MPWPPGRAGSQGIAVTSGGASADRLDRRVDLGAQFLRERRVAQAGQDRLAVGADEVAEEALDQSDLVSRQTLAAGDLVGDQDDRVRARGLGRVVDLQAQVVAGALDLRRAHGLRRRLRAQLDRAGAGVDLRHAQLGVHRVRPLAVGDRVLGGLDGLGHTGGLLLAGAGAGPLLGRLALPRATAGGGQVLGEVFRRTRLVGAEEDRDRSGRELGARVQLGDRRVVPGLDGALEDLRRGRAVEDELVDAGNVVLDRDRADDRREVQRRVALAALLRLVDLDLAVLRLGLQGRVRTAEVDLAGDELLDTRAGAGRVVVHRDVRALVVVLGDDFLDGVLLRGGAFRVERAGRAVSTGGGGRGRRVGGAGRRRGGRLRVATTGAECEQARDRDDGCGAATNGAKAVCGHERDLPF